MTFRCQFDPLWSALSEEYPLTKPPTGGWSWGPTPLFQYQTSELDDHQEHHGTHLKTINFSTSEFIPSPSRGPTDSARTGGRRRFRAMPQGRAPWDLRAGQIHLQNPWLLANRTGNPWGKWEKPWQKPWNLMSLIRDVPIMLPWSKWFSDELRMNKLLCLLVSSSTQNAHDIAQEDVWWGKKLFCSL